MRLIKSRPWRQYLNFFLPGAGQRTELHVFEQFRSKQLRRPVKISVILPPAYYESETSYPALYLNDGQDLEALNFQPTLERLYRRGKVADFITIAIHAGDRLQEYGTIGQPDYKKRGRKAKAYSLFLLRELLPALERRYRLCPFPSGRAVAGCSLGGLSAFDLAWHHPDIFGQVGVFSGSFWWRSQPFREAAPDADRIVQTYVETGHRKPNLRFWLQTGTKDETADRNKNGVIDAIDDTTDLIRALKKLGYREGTDIHYIEVSGGRHHPKTWGRVMPDFLQWAFPKRATNQ